MPLSTQILESELNDLEPLLMVDRSSTALQWSVLVQNYYAQSSVNGIPANVAALAPGISAFIGVLSTGSDPLRFGSLEFNSKFSEALNAFWGVVSPIAGTVWVQPPPAIATVATPPPVSGANAALLSVGGQNTILPYPDQDTANKRLAASLHPVMGVGGTVLVAVPPAAPVPVPIL